VIDGDISDFIDALMEVTDEFSTDELRRYLLGEGHSIADTIDGIAIWQKDRFVAIDPSWDRFKLSDAGATAVRELRDRID
jgi:hypothetical protein